MTTKHLAAIALILLPGCNPRHAQEPAAQKTAVQRVSSRPGNASGGILIVEYHRILAQQTSKKTGRWDTTVEAFRAQLTRLYRLGFRPVSLSSYIHDGMQLPAGASPVIFTFDDSSESQIRLLPDGRLDPECGLGILKSFSGLHGDFPVRATFFVLPPSGPFGPRNQVDRKLAMLKELSCELGSHTFTHPNLSRLSDSAVQDELKKAIAFITDHGYSPEAIALPLGIRPRNTTLLNVHSAVLLVGAGPAPSPKDPKRNLMALPRIQGTDALNGIDYWLDRVESGRFQPYVQP